MTTAHGNYGKESGTQDIETIKPFESGELEKRPTNGDQRSRAELTTSVVNTTNESKGVGNDQGTSGVV